MSTAKVKSYSWLQHKMWLVAGSEIAILKHCNTDYNRHAGIGFTLFMTGLFALFSGIYAGWYFSHSVWGAATFGIIWALLVFSIDRIMVTSLKKSPGGKNRRAMAAQVVIRVVLGGLIAFIISIPVELLVFQDNIDAAMDEYKNAQIIKLNQIGRQAFTLDADSIREAKARLEAAASAKAAAEDPRDPEFVNLKKEAGIAGKVVRDAQQAYNSALAAQQRIYAALPRDEDGSRIITRGYKDQKARTNAAKQKLAAAKSTLREIEADMRERRADWQKKQLGRQQHAENKADSARHAIETSIAKMDEQRNNLNSFQKRINQSFVMRFDVLGYVAYQTDEKGKLANPAILMFLWLIRALFFVIELLPSVVKIATPMGKYDFAVYQAERDFVDINLKEASRLHAESARQRVDKELAERERQMNERISQKGKLHDKLVAEALRHQGDIAQQLLADWRSRQEQKLKQNNTNGL
jgi:hypothetical protein